MTQGSETATAQQPLRPQLAALEDLLARPGEPVAELRRLAEPARLDFLFQVELSTLVRTGPRAADAGATPARLVSVAQAAAARGALPLATPGALRRRLAELAERLRQAGAWDPDAPLWWSPLPEPSPGESQWTACRLAVAPLRRRLATAFATTAAPRWLTLPSLVPAVLVRTLHGELEAAHRQGILDLERAGVGVEGRVSVSRSDSVLYLSGTEPELLASAPAAAALIQWCLRRLGGRLAEALPGTKVFPPATAMLARYPAPSAGYRPHLDNPGGAHDNGRTLTLVLYLNASGEECAGGEIALWAPGAATDEAPAAVAPPAGGSAVLFDARAVAHEVRPLAEGPARWALTLWMSDRPQRPAEPPALPELGLTDALLPIAEPPLPPGRVLFHELEDATARGRVTVRRVASGSRARCGVVCTVYRGGAALDDWCEHHLALGFDHLAIVFDRLEELAEAADASRLAKRFGAGRLTLWSGSRLAAERWGALPETLRRELEPVARSGSSNPAVAARQTLHASVALAAARSGELGGAPLDWLLHLDADELFYLEGDGCGGATLGRHIAAARDAGLVLLRYVDHELLQPWEPGAPPRFKLNPRLAAARLGAVGWSKLVAHLQMAQTAPRPWFTGYFNGKSAVAVAAGASAAGVHGWATRGAAAARFLAGPCVLHFHLADREAFRRKYLAVAAAAEPPGPALFEPSPVEVAARERIRSLGRTGAGEKEIARGLDELHAELTTFSAGDVEILEEAGLILRPRL